MLKWILIIGVLFVLVRFNFACDVGVGKFGVGMKDQHYVKVLER